MYITKFFANYPELADIFFVTVFLGGISTLIGALQGIDMWRYFSGYYDNGNRVSCTDSHGRLIIIKQFLLGLVGLLIVGVMFLYLASIAPRSHNLNWWQNTVTLLFGILPYVIIFWKMNFTK